MPREGLAVGAPLAHPDGVAEAAAVEGGDPPGVVGPQGEHDRRHGPAAVRRRGHRRSDLGPEPRPGHGEATAATVGGRPVEGHVARRGPHGLHGAGHGQGPAEVVVGHRQPPPVQRAAGVVGIVDRPSGRASRRSRCGRRCRPSTWPGSATRPTAAPARSVSRTAAAQAVAVGRPLLGHPAVDLAALGGADLGPEGGGGPGRSVAQHPQEVGPGGDRLGPQDLRRPARRHLRDPLQVVVEGDLVDGADPRAGPADLQDAPVLADPVEAPRSAPPHPARPAARSGRRR